MNRVGMVQRVLELGEKQDPIETLYFAIRLSEEQDDMRLEVVEELRRMYAIVPGPPHYKLTVLGRLMLADLRRAERLEAV